MLIISIGSVWHIKVEARRYSSRPIDHIQYYLSISTWKICSTMADGIPDGVETRAAVKSGKNSFGSDKDYKKVNQFSCMSCQKLFWSKTSLNRHVKEFHENVKPYTCQICHKSFRRKDYLKKHIQINGVKIKTCVLCISVSNQWPVTIKEKEHLTNQNSR